MAIQFVGTNPALNQFNARNDVANRQRSQEEQDFERRAVFDNAMGADKGLRNAIAAYYAQKQAAPTAAPSGPVMPPPAQVPVPNPAASTPVVSPDQSMVPADNPDYGGPSRAAPMPNAPPREGVDVPATVMAAPAPAPGPAAPVARAPASAPRNDFAPIMGELAKQPGTGHSMMQLFGADVASQRNAATERAKIHQEGIKLFADASKNNDVSTMRAVAQRYDLGIPPEALNRREVLAGIASGINLAKGMQITDDDKALAFAKGFMHAEASGADPRAAVSAGIAESQKVKRGFETKGHFVDDQGNVQFYDKGGELKASGAKARPLGYELESAGGGGAGAGSKQQQFAEWRIKTLVDSGMPEQQARSLVAGGASTKPMTEQQRVSLARGLMSQKDRFFRPLYKTLDEALRAVDAATGSRGGAGAAPPGGTQGPATSGPAGGLINQNVEQFMQQGGPSAAPAQQAGAPAPRRMRFDAMGNEIPQ